MWVLNYSTEYEGVGEMWLKTCRKASYMQPYVGLINLKLVEFNVPLGEFHILQLFYSRNGRPVQTSGEEEEEGTNEICKKREVEGLRWDFLSHFAMVVH